MTPLLSIDFKLGLPRNSCLYELGKTNTFRAASSKLFGGNYLADGVGNKGTNLQNINADIRRIYIPRDGYKFCQRDQDGAEARIVAYLCEDGKYKKLFQNEIKVHVFVAMHMFKKELKIKQPELDWDGITQYPIDKIKQHPQWKAILKLLKESDTWPAKERFYYLAKQTAHSANYGIKGHSFQMNVLDKSGGKIVLSKQEADYFLAFYRTMFPEIPKWNYSIMQELDKSPYLRNLFGHPRYFGGRKDNHFYLEANSFKPQSTVGEITHMAIRDTQLYIEREKKQWDVIQNNHDSLLVQFPDSLEEEKECSYITELYLNRDLASPSGEKFQMKSEYKSGYNWAFTL